MASDQQPTRGSKVAALLVACLVGGCAPAPAVLPTPTQAQGLPGSRVVPPSPPVQRPDPRPAPAIDCVTAASALSSELFEVPQECSIVLRVALRRGVVLDWQVFCGASGEVAVDEMSRVLEHLPERSARDVTIAYVSPGLRLAATNRVIENGGERPDWAVVSAHNGMLVFATDHRADPGQPVFPKTWRDAEPLMDDCPAWGLPDVTGFDARTHRKLEPQECIRALEPVSRTALPAALWSRGGMPRDATVLSFGDPEHGGDAWVVVINAGRSPSPDETGAPRG